MNTFLYIVSASALVSVLSFSGALSLVLKKGKIDNLLIFLISLSAGGLLGGAFLHLLPEAMEEMEPKLASMIMILAFIVFFLVEKILHWRHCHKPDCEVHTFGYMNLFGDSIHNFIDGLVIAAAFMTDIHLGIVTTLAVALHEIPQEIGDFGVLIYSGFKKSTALLFNFLVASFAMLGAILGYFLQPYFEANMFYLLPFAAGGFIYIAASDLVPEIRKEPSTKKAIISFLIFLAGIALMFAVGLLEG